MFRTLALIGTISAVALPALAQSTPSSDPSRNLAPSSAPAAAATLPNTFDGPARTPTAPAVPVAATGQSEVTEADMAEGALRAIIADLRTGSLDPELFTEALYTRLSPQVGTLRPVVEGFGPLGRIQSEGYSNGANQFRVTFANAVTQWVVGMSDDGRVSALLFRPAPAESSAAAPPARSNER